MSTPSANQENNGMRTGNEAFQTLKEVNYIGERIHEDDPNEHILTREEIM